MDNALLDLVESKLIEHGFDVPRLRRRDVRWLLRNITIRNAENTHLEEVLFLLTTVRNSLKG